MKDIIIKYKKALITISLILLLLSGLYTYLLLDLDKKWAQFNAIYLSNEGLKNNNNKLNLIKNSIVKSKEARNNILNYSIKNDENAIVDLIGEIEAHAKHSEIDWLINNIDKEDTGSSPSLSLEKIKVNMNVSGSWKKVTHFVDHIYSMPYSIEIKKVWLSKAENGKIGEANWDQNIEFYVLKQK